MQGYGDLQSIDSFSYRVSDLLSTAGSGQQTSYIGLILNDITTIGSGYEIYFSDVSGAEDNRALLRDIGISDETTFAINNSGDKHYIIKYKSATDTNYTEYESGDLNITGRYGLILNDASKTYNLK